MPFELGCKWTWEYLGSGFLGGVVAIMILPGGYASLPKYMIVDGEKRIYWGVIGRLVVAAIAGCVVDCNPRNAFFGGFFSWHAFRWMSQEGWNLVREGLTRMFGAKTPAK